MSRVFTNASLSQFSFASPFLLVFLCCSVLVLDEPRFGLLNSSSRSETDFRSALLSDFAGFGLRRLSSSGSLHVLLLRASPRPFRAPKKLSIHEMTPEFFVEFIYLQKSTKRGETKLTRIFGIWHDWIWQNFVRILRAGGGVRHSLKKHCRFEALLIAESLIITVIELLKGNHVPIWSETGEIKSEKKSLFHLTLKRLVWKLWDFDKNTQK